jgi:hypothetical protein
MAGGDQLWSEHHKVKLTESARRGIARRGDVSEREAGKYSVFCIRDVRVDKLIGGEKVRVVETYSVGCTHAPG